MTTPVYDWLSHHALWTPDKVALVDLYSNRSFTYAELDERATRLASALRDEYGISRGDRVGVLSLNSTDVFEIQFACAKLGAIFLPLNWRLTLPELEFIVKDATPSILMYGSELKEQELRLIDSCHIEKHIEMDGRGRTSRYEQSIADADPCIDLPRLTHDDTHTIMYTSGTTGMPKGALITHGMVFWNAVNLAGPVVVTKKTVNLVFLPLFHTAGLNVFANPTLHFGGRVVVMRSFDPALCLGVLQDQELNITHVAGMPTNYLMMAQQPEFADAELSHLEMCNVGGAPCPMPIFDVWSEKGITLQQGFGMTETGPSVMGLDADMAKQKIDSVGLPVLHTEVKLVNSEGNTIIGSDIVGELWVRGPNVTPGYWNRPDATAESITDGWLHTGDAARRDADGYYYIVDRWKDMYISGGENVYPVEVENVIYELEEVSEAAVIGIPHDLYGETGQVVIVLEEGSSLSEEQIFRHCDAKLARFKHPKSVRFVESLPRNASGKVLKRVLREEA